MVGRTRPRSDEGSQCKASLSATDAEEVWQISRRWMLRHSSEKIGVVVFPLKSWPPMAIEVVWAAATSRQKARILAVTLKSPACPLPQPQPRRFLFVSYGPSCTPESMSDCVNCALLRSGMTTISIFFVNGRANGQPDQALYGLSCRV